MKFEAIAPVVVPPVSTLTGLENGYQGHYLQDIPETDRYERCYCTCDWTFYLHIKKDGKASAKSLREWNEHLDNVQTSADTVIELGEIQRKRDKWILTARLSTHPNVTDYFVDMGDSHFSRWLLTRLNATPGDGSNSMLPVWVLCAEVVSARSTKKKLIAWDHSKEGIVVQGFKTLSKFEATGNEITTFSDFLRPVINVETSSVTELFSSIMERAKNVIAASEANRYTQVVTLHDVEGLQRQISEICSLTDTLRMYSPQLEAVRQKNVAHLTNSE